MIIHLNRELHNENGLELRSDAVCCLQTLSHPETTITLERFAIVRRHGTKEPDAFVSFASIGEEQRKQSAEFLTET
jgi:hypothetical protein